MDKKAWRLYKANRKFVSVKIEGQEGTWTEIDMMNVNVKESLENENLYLMESDIYGEEVHHIIIDEEGEKVATGIHDGWDDLLYYVTSDIPEREWKCM